MFAVSNHFIRHLHPFCFTHHYPAAASAGSSVKIQTCSKPRNEEWSAQLSNVWAHSKGCLAHPKRMNFRKSPEGWRGIFNPKLYIADFCHYRRYFGHEFRKQICNMIFRKWGGGSKAVWTFSENSSVLDVSGIPKSELVKLLMGNWRSSLSSVLCRAMWDGSKTQASNWDACTICNKTVARVVTLWLGRNIETQLCSTDSWTGWPSTDTHGHLMCAQVWSEFDDYQQRKILQGKRVTNLSILASLRINNPSINHHLAPLTMAECNGVRRSRSSQLGSAPENIIWGQI